MEFVHNLGIMYDALSELSDLSKQLKKKNITLAEAILLFSKQVQISAPNADSLGAFVTWMAVPNKTCPVKILNCLRRKLLKSK